MLKPNEGLIDRVLRVTLGLVLVLAALLLGALQGSTVGLVLGGFALLPLITGIVGVCPLYVPFGFSTVGLGRQLMGRCMSRVSGSGRRGCGDMAAMCGHGSRARHAPTSGTL